MHFKILVVFAFTLHIYWHLCKATNLYGLFTIIFFWSKATFMVYLKKLYIYIYIYIYIFISLKAENTLKSLKKQKYVPCTKKLVEKKKVTTDLPVFFPMFQKFMKGVCTIRSMMFFKINVWDINSDFAGVSIPKMNFFLWKKRCC